LPKGEKRTFLSLLSGRLSGKICIVNLRRNGNDRE
jgi:hypothetical protein